MEPKDLHGATNPIDGEGPAGLPSISGIPRRQPPALPADGLVGREQDLDRLRALLDDAEFRIITLLGPGGVGKTRLALTIAHELASDFRDGVLFVRLDRAATSSIFEAIGRQLPVTPGEGGSWEHAVTAALQTQNLLFVLDNCESMPDGIGEIPALLAACPGIRVVATSRETLRLPGEHEAWIQPLPVPGGTDDDPPSGEENPAVQLFRMRARKVSPDLPTTASVAATVREIVRRLDGLPLAIELTAAYLRHLSPDEVLTMLEEAMPALGGGARTLPERHQSLRDLVRWSLDMLPPSLREDAIRLSIFPNGFSPRAAAAVIDNRSPHAAWDLLMTLADKSLIIRSPATRRSETRFSMLQTIRSVLLEALQETPGLLDETLDRLARALVEVAKEADRHYHGPEGIDWLRRMRLAHADVHLVIMESLARPALRDTALELCGDMFWFWYSQGHYQWALPRIEELLALAGETAPPLVRARAHVTAGWFAHRMAQIERTEMHFTAARPLFGATPSRGSLLGMIGDAYVLTFDRPDTPAAIRELERVIELAPQVENAWHEQAAGHFGIGILRYFDGLLDDARRHLIETLRLGRAHDDAQSIGMSLMYLAHVDRASGHPAEAFWKLREALPLLMEIGDLATTALVLDIVSATLVELDACEPAMQALALGEHLRSTMSLPRSPLEEPDAAATRCRIEAWMRTSAAAAPADGSTLDLGQTIDRLLRFDPDREGGRTTPEPTSPPSSAATILSPRELEVLHLISTGMTSSEIAGALFVSPHTVKRHMANIREKLGVRSQAAAIAALRDWSP